jgi:hypothetical protein
MDELEQIRRDTDPIPAPEQDKAPPMTCPACGELMVDGVCPDPDCEN